MIFEFEGQKYRLGFRYESHTLSREIAVKGELIMPGRNIRYPRIPGRQISLVVTETKRWVVCRLWISGATGPADAQWLAWGLLAQGISRCSLEDRYIRKIGQGKALKKLFAELESGALARQELADKIRELWRNRFTRTPAKTRMAANSGSAAQNTKAEERAEAPNTKE